MSVEYASFLELAKHSLTLNGELWTRNAISRAYYGMYHSALRITEGMVPSHTDDGERLSGGVHMRMYTNLCSGEAASLKNLNVEAVQKIGVKLKMTHSLRVNSDYKLERKVNRITALSVVKDAEDLDTSVNQLLNTLDRSLIA